MKIAYDSLDPFFAHLLQPMFTYHRPCGYCWSLERLKRWKKYINVTDTPCSYYHWLNSLFKADRPVHMSEVFPNKSKIECVYDYTRNCLSDRKRLIKWYSGVTTRETCRNLGFTESVKIGRKTYYKLTENGQIFIKALNRLIEMTKADV